MEKKRSTAIKADTKETSPALPRRESSRIKSLNNATVIRDSVKTPAKQVHLFPYVEKDCIKEKLIIKLAPIFTNIKPKVTNSAAALKEQNSTPYFDIFNIKSNKCGTNSKPESVEKNSSSEFAIGFEKIDDFKTSKQKSIYKTVRSKVFNDHEDKAKTSKQKFKEKSLLFKVIDNENLVDVKAANQESKEIIIHDSPPFVVDLKETDDVEKEMEIPSEYLWNEKYISEALIFPKISHIQQLSLPNSIVSYDLKLIDFLDNQSVFPRTWDKYCGFLDDIPLNSSLKGFASNKRNNIKVNDKRIPRFSTPKRASKRKSINTDNECNDLIFTDKFKSLSTLKGIWDKDAVVKFKLWLEEWNHEPQKSIYNDDSNSSIDCMNKCMLITGLPGSGKTSLVHTLAKDLNFKVIEMNCSSKRCGNHIKNKLKEAILSYHVDYTKSSTAPIENSKKDAESSRKKRKSLNKKDDTSTVPSPKIFGIFQDKSNLKKESKPTKMASSNKNKKLVKPIEYTVSLSSQTIILFDDVDVIFEQDEGFWKAINEFIKYTKKPIVLTATNSIPLIKKNLKENYDNIHLNLPELANANEFLSSAMGKLGMTPISNQVNLFLKYQNKDIRRSLLQLQFWTSVKNKTIIEDFENKIFLNFSNGTPQAISSILDDPSISNINTELMNQISLGYDVLYESLPSYWAPSTEIETLLSVDSNLFKEPSNDLDMSWLDDSVTETKSEDKVSNGNPLVLTSESKELLNQLSQSLDNISDSDILLKACSYQYSSLTLRDKMEKFQSGLPLEVTATDMPQSELPLEVPSLVSLLAYRQLSNSISHSLPQLLSSESVLPSSEATNFRNVYSSVLKKTSLLNCLDSGSCNLDYLSFIRRACCLEEKRSKDPGKRSRRFLHYLDSVGLNSKDITNYIYSTS